MYYMCNIHAVYTGVDEYYTACGTVRCAVDQDSESRVTMFSPTKSSIKEANDHFQALYQRIADLENTVKEQASALMHRDESSQANIKGAVRKKDLEIAELHKSMAASEARVQKLLTQNKEKDAEIEQLRAKAQLLEDACNNLPALESCLWTLKQAQDLIVSTGSVRSRHPSHGSSSRSRSASGALSPTSPESGGLYNHSDDAMGMDVSAPAELLSGHALGNGRDPVTSSVHPYTTTGNRSFSISDVEDDGESQSTTV